MNQRTVKRVDLQTPSMSREDGTVVKFNAAKVASTNSFLASLVIKIANLFFISSYIKGANTM